MYGQGIYLMNRLTAQLNIEFRLLISFKLWRIFLFNI